MAALPTKTATTTTTTTITSVPDGDTLTAPMIDRPANIAGISRPVSRLATPAVGAGANDGQTTNDDGDCVGNWQGTGTNQLPLSVTLKASVVTLTFSNGKTSQASAAIPTSAEYPEVYDGDLDRFQIGVPRDTQLVWEDPARPSSDRGNIYFVFDCGADGTAKLMRVQPYPKNGQRLQVTTGTFKRTG